MEHRILIIIRSTIVYIIKKKKNFSKRKINESTSKKKNILPRFEIEPDFVKI